MFRGKMRDFLIRAVRRGALVVPPNLTVARAVSLFNRLSRSDWNTRIQETYRHGCSVAGYLAKYVCGSPISGRRIERVDSDEIVFWYRDHRDGQQKLMRVTPHEFLNRWFEHMPTNGLRMIRRSGLYANCNARQRKRVCEQLSAEDGSAASKQAAAGIKSLDPQRCPRCNTDVVTQLVYRPLPRVLTWHQPPVVQARAP